MVSLRVLALKSSCLLASLAVVWWAASDAGAQTASYGPPATTHLTPSGPELFPPGGRPAPATYQPGPAVPLPPAAPTSFSTAVDREPVSAAPAYYPIDPSSSGSRLEAAALDAGVVLPQPSSPADPPNSGPSPSLVDQMLGGTSYGRSAFRDSPLLQSGGDPFDDLIGQSASDCCEPYATCPQSLWYASAAGLILNRDRPNGLWTSHDPDNEAIQLMSTSEAGLSWRGGAEIRFGRRFCCDTWALEATYWGVWAMAGSARQLPPGANGVSTPLDMRFVQFGVGDPLADYFDGAEQHRLWRRDEFHNVELNLIRNNLFGPDPARLWDLRFSLGVRFFRFEESLTFGTLANGGTWGGSDGEEAYLGDQIINNLVGFQFGFDADYCFWRNLRLFVAPRIGIYNNHIQNDFRVYRDDGLSASPTAPGITGSYPVHSTRDVFSLLAQIDLGIEWQFGPRWNAHVGYRVVAATGIGLADNQIPACIVDLPGIRDIDYNGDLLLHGAFAALTYQF